MFWRLQEPGNFSNWLHFLVDGLAGVRDLLGRKGRGGAEPRAFAAARPVLVSSWLNDRSNSAMPANIINNAPCRFPIGKRGKGRCFGIVDRCYQRPVPEFDATLWTGVNPQAAERWRFNGMLLDHSDAALIVNISSIAGVMAMGSNIAYCASKAAVDNLTKSLARALAPKIRVISVSPGVVDTDFIKRLDQAWRDSQASRIPRSNGSARQTMWWTPYWRPRRPFVSRPA